MINETNLSEGGLDPASTGNCGKSHQKISISREFHQEISSSGKFRVVITSVKVESDIWTIVKELILQSCPQLENTAKEFEKIIDEVLHAACDVLPSQISSEDIQEFLIPIISTKLSLFEQVRLKKAEYKSLYSTLFGDMTVITIAKWLDVTHSNDEVVQSKIRKFSDLKLDLLEYWFDYLCENRKFPVSKSAQWVFLLPSHDGNLNVDFEYFNSEDEASERAFVQVEFPRVIFTGKVKLLNLELRLFGENIENELTQAKMIILKMIENNFYPQKFHIDHLIPSRHSSDLLLSSMQESSFWPPHTKRVNGVVVCKWSFIDTLGRHPEA
jgi:hypothetical protein